MGEETASGDVVKDDLTVGWVGLGKLGLPCATTLAHYTQYRVVGHDPKLSSLDDVDSDEPGTMDLLGRKPPLELRDTIRAVVNEADVVFVAVQTPHSPEYDGSETMPTELRDFDYVALRQACREIATSAQRAERHVHLVVISTVLPGTMDKYVRPLLNKYVTLVYNPFFIAMGSTIEDFLHPAFVLIGTDDTTNATPIEAIYSKLHNAPLYKCSVPSAELIKVSYNTFISMKIVFANTLMEICSGTGADVDEVTDALALATDRVVSPKYLRAGMGDGGACLLPGELVITEGGPKPIEKIQVGERVLTLEGELRPVVQTWQRDYDGPIVSYGARGLPPVTVTADHPVIAREDLRPRRRDGRKSTIRPFARSAIKEVAAGELTAEHLVTWPDYRGEALPLPDYATPEYLELAGWYLSEGSLDLSARRGRLAFALHIDEVEEANRIAELLAICEVPRESGRGANSVITIQVRPHAKGRVVRFGNMGLARRLYADFGKGAGEKYLPPWALWSEPKTAALLLEGLLKGDGRINAHGVSFSTISESLAWGVHILLTRLGATPNTRVIPERPGHRRSFEVRVRNRTQAREIFAAVNIDTRPVGIHEVTLDPWRQVRLGSVGEYTGPVHNLWVQGSHTFVTAAGAVHNCHPRDLIAMAWLSEHLGLSHNLFKQLVRAREAQTVWLMDQVINRLNFTDLDEIIVLGRAYKADVGLCQGSPAVLLYNYLRSYVENVPDANFTVNAYDPHVEGFSDSPSPKRPAVYVIATNHSAFKSYKFPPGSVVIDPWRFIAPQPGVTVIGVGSA